MVDALAKDIDKETIVDLSDKRGSDQDQHDTVSLLYQYCCDTVSPFGHQKVSSLSGQGQVSSIGSRSGQDQVSDSASQSIILAPQQQRVYKWFLNRGFSGFFNVGMIHRETSISEPTIRKCIIKMQKRRLIRTGVYDNVSRLKTYELSKKFKVRIFDHQDPEGSGLSQGKISNSRSGLSQGQVNKSSTSYKIDRQIYNSISVCLQKSDYWRSQGLTMTKITQWLNDDQNPIPADIIPFIDIHLVFAQNLVEVRSAKSPLSYLRGGLRKGGFRRPDYFLKTDGQHGEKFELPDERAIRLKMTELDRRKKQLEKMELIRSQELELADKEAFLSFLQDKEAVRKAMTKLQGSFVGSRLKRAFALYKTTGQIDSAAEDRLFHFFKGQGS